MFWLNCPISIKLIGKNTRPKSEETKRKLSDALTNSIRAKEQRQRLWEFNRGRRRKNVKV